MLRHCKEMRIKTNGNRILSVPSESFSSVVQQMFGSCDWSRYWWVGRQTPRRVTYSLRRERCYCISITPTHAGTWIPNRKRSFSLMEGAADSSTLHLLHSSARLPPQHLPSARGPGGSAGCRWINVLLSNGDRAGRDPAGLRAPPLACQFPSSPSAGSPSWAPQLKK